MIKGSSTGRSPSYRATVNITDTAGHNCIYELIGVLGFFNSSICVPALIQPAFQDKQKALSQEYTCNIQLNLILIGENNLLPVFYCHFLPSALNVSAEG